METLWKMQSCDIKDKNEFRKDVFKHLHWDAVVVGGGIAGILIAYYLQEAGKSVLVLESNEIASGQTAGTTAKITSQHDLKYADLIRKVGRKKARLYADSNECAIDEYEKLIKEKNIDCDFVRCSSYLYSVKDSDVLKREANAASSLGIDAFFTDETELPFDTAGAVCFKNQAKFSPLKFIRHLASELNIKEHTKVLKVSGKSVYTNDGVFTGDKVIIATHYPILNIPGLYFMRQHQQRSYVLALSGCDKINSVYKGIEKDSISVRQAGEYILVGGVSHRSGIHNCSSAYNKLIDTAKKYFPKGDVKMMWSAQDCMPHDGIPFIGRYSVFTPNMYVATGFQKWGMTTSMTSALIIRDMILGVKNPYTKLYTPQRINIRAGYKAFFIDLVESIKGLTKGLFTKEHRCTHLGCELSWNPDENTWDCPCHGSRFKDNGVLICAPSKLDLKIRRKRKRRK